MKVLWIPLGGMNVPEKQKNDARTLVSQTVAASALATLNKSTDKSVKKRAENGGYSPENRHLLLDYIQYHIEQHR